MYYVLSATDIELWTEELKAKMASARDYRMIDMEEIEPYRHAKRYKETINVAAKNIQK
jgi:hypothetical protein